MTNGGPLRVTPYGKGLLRRNYCLPHNCVGEFTGWLFSPSNWWSNTCHSKLQVQYLPCKTHHTGSLNYTIIYPVRKNIFKGNSEFVPDLRDISKKSWGMIDHITISSLRFSGYRIGLPFLFIFICFWINNIY